MSAAPATELALPTRYCPPGRDRGRQDQTGCSRSGATAVCRRPPKPDFGGVQGGSLLHCCTPETDVQRRSDGQALICRRSRINTNRSHRSTAVRNDPLRACIDPGINRCVDLVTDLRGRPYQCGTDQASCCIAGDVIGVGTCASSQQQASRPKLDVSVELLAPNRMSESHVAAPRRQSLSAPSAKRSDTRPSTP